MLLQHCHFCCEESQNCVEEAIWAKLHEKATLPLSGCDSLVFQSHEFSSIAMQFTVLGLSVIQMCRQGVLLSISFLSDGKTEMSYFLQHESQGV